MGLFADRTFDALASLVSDEPGALHRLVHREPQDVEAASTLKSLEQLSAKLATWPYLGFTHPSRILPNLGLCPNTTLGYLLGWLPAPLKEAAIVHSGQQPKQMPPHPLAQRFIASTWSKFLDTLPCCPAAFAPSGKNESLLKMQEKELKECAQYMALYALEPHLKHFIDKKARENIKDALQGLPYARSLAFIRFLQKSRKQLDVQLPFTFPLHLWNGKAQALDELVSKFGLACLTRIINQEDEDFCNELRCHVSELFWSQLPPATASQKPEVMVHLNHAFELSYNFLGNLSS